MAFVPSCQMPRPLLATVLALAAAVAVLGSACARPDDQPRLRGELTAAAAGYDARLDELKHRAEDLDHRRQALPHDALDAAAAEHSLGQARLTIENLRSFLRSARTRAAGIKPGGARELSGILDEVRQRLEAGITEATSNLEAVESWEAIAARRAQAGAQPPPPQPEPNESNSESNDDRPETDRTGAPIR
jgi:hypothetical protein